MNACHAGHRLKKGAGQMRKLQLRKNRGTLSGMRRSRLGRYFAEKLSSDWPGRQAGQEVNATVEDEWILNEAADPCR